VGVPPIADPSLEATAIISFVATQPLEGFGIRVLYLAKRASCQLASANTPQILMDPPLFMLAPLSMTDAEYQLWRNGIPYSKQLMGDLDYKEFSKTRLMPSFPIGVCILSLSSFFSLYLAHVACDDAQM